MENGQLSITEKLMIQTAIARKKEQAQNMSTAELHEEIVDLYRNMMLRENEYQRQLKEQWGITNGQAS